MKRSLWAWSFRETYLEKMDYELDVSHCPVIAVSAVSKGHPDVLSYTTIPQNLHMPVWACRCSPDTLH